MNIQLWASITQIVGFKIEISAVKSVRDFWMHGSRKFNFVPILMSQNLNRGCKESC